MKNWLLQIGEMRIMPSTSRQSLLKCIYVVSLDCMLIKIDRSTCMKKGNCYRKLSDAALKNDNP